MAGYSGTPLAQKLGIKAGQKVITINAPAGYSKLLEPLPEAVSFTQKAPKGTLKSRISSQPHFVFAVACLESKVQCAFPPPAKDRISA